MRNARAGYRMEKSRLVVETLCRIRNLTKDVPPEIEGWKNDLHRDLEYALYNATKLFCDAVSEWGGWEGQWSPKLVKRLCANPEKVDEILSEVQCEEYRDQEYIDGFEQGPTVEDMQ